MRLPPDDTLQQAKRANARTSVWFGAGRCAAELKRRADTNFQSDVLPNPDRLLTTALALLVGAAACASGARPAASDSAGVHGAAVRFLAAFDSLQWEPFRAALAPDVTVFMPGSADPPARLDGRAAVEAEFRRFFDEVRAGRVRQGRTAPPFLGIGPRVRDLRVQLVGRSAAAVSFHLRAGEAPPSRRSLVLRREPDGAWRVVHWHASGAPRPSGS